jgi:putative transposase
MITRRSVRRHFLFRPDAEMNHVFLYALAVAAQEHQIEIHCATLMSTHEHLIATDTLGKLPQFTAALHRIVALGTKVLRKWEGSVWDNNRPSIVHLTSLDAVIQKCGYVMANPVVALAVEYARQWPGVWFGAHDVGRRVVRVPRPNIYCDPKNAQWPEEAELVLTLPPALRARYDADEARAVLGAEQHHQEQDARDEAKRRGIKFLGALKVRLCSPYRRATSYEPLLERNPTFAVGRGNRAAFFAAVQWVREFRNAYAQALRAWRRGLRQVLFPFGTWQMRQLHAVQVQGAPAG